MCDNLNTLYFFPNKECLKCHNKLMSFFFIKYLNLKFYQNLLILNEIDYLMVSMKIKNKLIKCKVISKLYLSYLLYNILTLY